MLINIFILAVIFLVLTIIIKNIIIKIKRCEMSFSIDYILIFISLIPAWLFLIVQILRKYY